MQYCYIESVLRIKKEACALASFFLGWLRTESNRRHKDFQSFALPTELLSQLMAVWTGLEPATSCVTGRHSNQLNYQTKIILMAVSKETVLASLLPTAKCR